MIDWPDKRTDKCNTLFNSARMPRLPVLRTGNFTQNATRNNSTSLARIALWPCLGDDCHDVFSQACMRKMMRHCAKDSSFAGCTILFDLCPFKPPLESYKSWVCLDNECTMNIRGKGCQDVMAKECSAMDLDDRPLICDAFLSKPIPQKDGETTLTEKWINAMTFPDPVAIEMTRIDNNKLAQLLPDLPVFGHYDFVGAPVSSVFTSNSADLTAPATGTPASEVAKPEVAHPEDADDESSSISSGVTLGGFQPGQFFPPPLAPLTPAVEIMEDFPDGIPRQRPPMFPSS